MKRPSHGTVVAYIALFVALGGTAFALATNSVKSKHIKDGAVKLADVNQEALNDLLTRGAAHGPEDSMRFYSYFTDTATTADYEFGDILVRMTGTAGEYEFCRDPSPVIYPWVNYVDGVRSTGTFPISNNQECTSAFDVAQGGDFQISTRSTLIFGVHIGGATDYYQLFGFGRF